jgi:hypothetical protein
MDRTGAERQRRWRAKLKAAAAPQTTIRRIFSEAAAANFAIDAIEFSADGSITVRPRAPSGPPAKPDRDDFDDGNDEQEARQ